MKKKENKKIEKDEEDEAGAEEEKDVKIDEKEEIEKLKKFKKELEKEVDVERDIILKSSKSIDKIKKGDKIKVDSLVLEVDAHYVLIDHGGSKEMAIEAFDEKTDRDYQIRYFSNSIKESIEVYRLDEILYNKIRFAKLEW